MPRIHPTAIVEDGARLGEDVVIGPYCTVNSRAVLDDGVHLHSHVVVTGDTTIGAGTAVHPFAVLGGPAQDMKHSGTDGRLVIGRENVIREHVTVNSGSSASTGLTTMGDRCYLMINSHIAHDCIVGDGVILSNGAVLAGHVTLGDQVIIGGNSAIHQFVRIGGRVMIGGVSGSEDDVIPYGFVRGSREGLRGLNLVGLKRNGFSRPAIREIQTAFDMIFQENDGQSINSRVDTVARKFPDNAAVAEIVDFIRAPSKRPLLTPGFRKGRQND